jgi:restriction endonuclease S subunit
MNLSKEKWRNVPLGNICNVLRGDIITKKTIVSGNIPVIASAIGPSYYHNKANRNANIITITCSGNAGYIDFYDTPIYASDCITVEPIDKSANEVKYIYYVLKSVESKIKSLQRGTAQKHIYPKDIIPLEIPLPNQLEQKFIAGLFHSIEMSALQLNLQEKELLQLKNKLLKDLFSEKKEFGSHLIASDFETVRFDKVAINVSERVEPKKTILSTYVGLEHLEADNLKIESTGSPSDVIGTKLKIYKGDIIFGKRRAYLRKLAVSHFDGIASAHSMILRANEQYIDKDFLPYFMQSDSFMSRAVQISEGSLSPTIKNKTLANQEFIMPIKTKQKELIALFNQFEKAREQLKQQKITLNNLKNKLLNEILG